MSRRLAYGSHPEQFAELSRPDAAGPVAVVVLLHGGFWRARYTLDLMRPLADDLVDRGLAVWNLEYRRVGSPEATWPDTLLDVTAGVDALADHAEPAGLDLDRVVLVGHSAGGHLALWAAGPRRPPEQTLPRRVRPTAVVSLAGVCDLRGGAADDLGDGAVTAFLGGGPEHCPKRYDAASPLEGLPLRVPQLLVHGTADRKVPVKQSLAYSAAARAAGDDVQLLELDGVDHMALIDPTSDAWARTVDALVRLSGVTQHSEPATRAVADRRTSGSAGR